MPKLIAIVAHDPNRLIGRDGDLPWHLPGDLAFFKRTTSGHPILMGRKTFDSIGRPLPKRQNIILTRDPQWSADGTTIIQHPDQLPSLQLSQPEPVFIIGGAQIYQLFLPLLDELIVTHVHQTHQGDTHFPEYNHLFPHSEVLESHDDFTIRRHLPAQLTTTKN
ncbi:MAG: dihydrofolate reductase [Verrucomicrobiota bacterium]